MVVIYRKIGLYSRYCRAFPREDWTIAGPWESRTGRLLVFMDGALAGSARAYRWLACHDKMPP